MRILGAGGIGQVNLTPQRLESGSQQCNKGIENRLEQRHGVEQLGREVGEYGIVQEARQRLRVVGKNQRSHDPGLIGPGAAQLRIRVQVDVEDAAYGLCDGHGRGTTVPADLGDALRYARVCEVRVLPRILAVGLCAVKGRDRCLVGDAALSDGPVGKEPGYEVVAAHDDEAAGCIKIEPAVGRPRRSIAVLEMLLDGIDVVSAVAFRQGLLVQLLEQLRLEGEVVALEIKVVAGRRRIPFEFACA